MMRRYICVHGIPAAIEFQILFDFIIWKTLDCCLHLRMCVRVVACTHGVYSDLTADISITEYVIWYKTRQDRASTIWPANRMPWAARSPWAHFRVATGAPICHSWEYSEPHRKTHDIKYNYNM